VNFLDDNSKDPHMKLTAIDKAFGVGESTGQGKSKEIRTMLRIRPMDHHWTPPSRMDDNIMVWMLNVNGLVMDIRRCPSWPIILAILLSVRRSSPLAFVELR